MSIYSKRNVWCAIFLYFTLVQVGYGLNRYCLKEVDYCFTITLPQNNETLVHFRLEAPSTAGWLGLGIGKDMTGYLMIAWANDDGSITLSQREGEEGVQPLATDQQSDLQLNMDTNFAYAYSTLNPYDKDINAYLARHDYNGHIKLNLADGVSELSQYDRLIIAHAALMFSAWLVIIPGAVFIARFARNFLPTTWFKLHVGIQVFLSLPVIIAGSSLSFAAAGNLTFDDPHKIVGFVLFLGFFIQLAIGAIHHHLYDPKRLRTPWWTQLHWWFGRALVVLAAFQIPLGLKLYGVDMAYYYIYYIYLFILLIAFSFLSFRLWNRGQDNGFKRMRDSQDDGFKQMQNS
ncbi:hypothetical protein RCL_jg3098.t1 [Rhizophagus clarus]|uniref:Cytochrome b561 domain-containing protein n=1 Tax=Rhizophagus clarus TaxID=94130 RepID=A0A8H3M9F3_9GLOM|nr:hypothetical protein RCL_jg3098.t1 [Rhizophagus clarus]